MGFNTLFVFKNLVFEEALTWKSLTKLELENEWLPLERPSIWRDGGRDER